MNNLSNPSHSISLRKFPYPFKAGFSICSDIDGTTVEDFVLIHSFLNTRENTPLGQGLGLELADSFWFYSHRNTPDHAFCYFEEDNKTPSKYAPIIRKFIKSGYIDTLHSYGNFSRYGGFSRQLAERCLEELDKLNLYLDVWVNHGDEFNSQNIGFAPHHLGDKPNDPVQSSSNYHIDLLTNAGFTYFWDAETSLTKVIGQDKSFRWHQAHFNRLLTTNTTDRLKMLAQFCLNIWKKKSVKNNNQLLTPVKLADGNTMLNFKRYGSGRYDWSDDLPLLLQSDMLHLLVLNKGSCILYVHWGDRKNRSYPLPFSQKAVKAFEYLASLYYKGDLWVTTTRKLLNHSFFIYYLDWTIEENETGSVIQVKGHNCSGLNQKKINIDDLQGLTFYTHRPETTVVKFDDRIVNTVPNPKDESGQQSVSIPFSPLVFPTDP